MSSPKHNSLYPEVVLSNPEAPTSSSTSPTTPSLYPSVDMDDLAQSLFPDGKDDAVPTKEELLIKIPGSIVHLIERDQSVELASGDFSVVGLKQGETTVAVLVRVGEDKIQWPLAKDEASVKLDGSHYFFTLRVPGEEGAEILNYGVTFASKGQEGLLRELDRVLESHSCFEVKEVKGGVGKWEVVSREVSPEELMEEEKGELVEKSSAAYWTVLAPNVEDYSGSFARMIAAGSGQLVKGILWCGDVTVDRLKWGHEVLKKRAGKKGDEDLEVSPGTSRRIKRVKRLTKMSEKMAIGILSGVVKVSGFFTSSIVNSKVGKKFFSLLPGEIVLASLDGFNKVCDAVEVAGKNVMTTSSVVTTGLVSQRYGEKAAKATNEGLDAAGHVIGTAWAVFKIRKALNPKSAFKPTTLVKAAAEANSSETKAKNKK